MRVAGAFASLADKVVAVGSVTAVFVSWELVSIWADVPNYLVPRPSAFVGRVWTDSHLLALHTLASLRVITIGLAFSVLLAVPLAYLVTTFRRLREWTYPLIEGFQYIPKTILAPLMIVWFGLGDLPKIGLVVLMTLFPILLNSMAGFRAVDPRIQFLSKSMGATWWQHFRLITVPASMPFIFSGMKIGVIYAVNAAIIGEFIGSSEGLGYLILSAAGTLDTSLAFSAMVMTALLGVALSLVLISCERLLMPWLATFDTHSR